MQKFKERLARLGGSSSSSSSSSSSKGAQDEKPRARRQQSGGPPSDPRGRRRDGDLVVLYDGTRGAGGAAASTSSLPPPPAPPPADRLSIDIVLVPGLNESNTTAWTRGDVCWPRDLLSRDFPRARIMVWSWRGGLSATSGTFSTQAENLLVDLRQARTGTDRPILFQGHGLGGLIIKEALVLAAVSRIYETKADIGNVYPQTMGAAFWGTPHVRSRNQPLGEWLALAALLAPAPPQVPLIRSLRNSGEAFEQLHSTWLMVSRDIQITCVREDLPTVVYVPSDVAAECEVPGIKKGPNQIMIPKDVAGYSVANVRTHIVNANHADIVKFSGRDDPLYREGVKALKKVATGPTQAEMDAQSPRCQEILDAIYYDSMSEREAGIEPAHSQTCDWFLPSIKDFLNSDDSLLWISGKAGSGKSTLMKYAWSSEALRKELQQGWARDGELVVIRAYFFESGRSIQKSMEGFLRSTMFQILSERRDLIRVAFPTFFDGPWPPTTLFTSITNLQQGWFSLFSHMSQNMRLLVLIDGIEEYRIVDRKDHYDPKDRDLTYTVDVGDESWGSNKWIADSNAEFANLILTMTNKDMVKYVFTGRELPVFEQTFAGLPRIRMQEHTEEAVANYIQGRLRVEAPGLPQMQSLCQHLSQKSNGDFLWAKIAIDVLVESPLRTLGAAIEALPQQLGGTDGLYMYMLKKLSAEERKAAHHIFWLALRVQQAPTIITLALAHEGYLDSTGHELRVRGDDVTPHTSQSIQKLTEDMTHRLYSTCARLLEAEAPSNSNWSETGQRVVFRHLTAKEWVARRDIWERLGVPMVSEVHLDFCLLSGLVRHIKTFGGAQKPMVLAWPVPRFRPDAWFLIAKALRVAERLDGSVSDEESAHYFDLLDELDLIGQRAWISALDKHKPLYEDPEWYAKRLPALHKKHWSSCEPMEVGKPPKRKDFLALAVQANLLRYVGAKLQRLEPDERKSRAQGLISCVVSPQPEGRSACVSLSGDFVDFHHDMPDSRLLDVLFAAGADPQSTEKIWLKTLKTGRRFFQRSHMTMTHLLETGASQRLMLNRERWVAAIKALLLRGADPRVEVKISTESTADEASSTTTVAAAEFIRDTLEGEPEYAVELLELEKLMGSRGGNHEK